MKKYIIIIFALLYSCFSVNLLFAATFAQADLTGTWHMNVLRPGFHSDGTTPLNKWVRGTFMIDSSGVVTCVSMSDSTGVTTCPGSFDLTLTMNPSTGVITQTGVDAPNVGTDHMTMASNKGFAAGTATNGSDPGYKYQLVIIQKEVTGTSYSADDLQDKSFVFHELSVGGENKWSYGTGTINTSGAITLTSETDPFGTTGPDTPGVTLAVDGAGVVTMIGAGMATYQGFMSDDKKTIVGTFTDGDAGSECYHLMIIQITGQTYTAGSLPAGTLSTHVVGSGAMPFWIHYTNTVDNSGVMTFSDWVASDPMIIAPVTTLTGYIDASGTVTMAGNPTFHGQVSHDSTFTVSTQTEGTGPDFFYMLSVSTRVDDAILYADLGTLGLWKHDGTSWTRLAPENPENIAASGSILYADLGTLGLWKHDGTSWTRLAPENPENIAASGSILYADLGTLGLWKHDGTSWTRLAPENPENIAASGSILYADLGTLGLWKHDGTSWTRLAPENPENIAASGSILYADLGTLGLWKHDGTSWTRLAPENPENIAASGSILYADLGTLGLWKHDGTSWTRLAPENPENIAASGSILYADFGTLGLWKHDGTSWTRLAPENPENIAVGF